MASSSRCFVFVGVALFLCVFFLGSTTAGLFGPAQPADDYDYIVIGAGACGAVLATRLAGTSCVCVCRKMEGCFCLPYVPSDSFLPNQEPTPRVYPQSLF